MRLASRLPADTDPEEPAQVILLASYNQLDDDDDVGADDDLTLQSKQTETATNRMSREPPAGHVESGHAVANIKTLNTTVNLKQEFH
jgi:hypothetical protein